MADELDFHFGRVDVARKYGELLPAFTTANFVWQCVSRSEPRTYRTAGQQKLELFSKRDYAGDCLQDLVRQSFAKAICNPTFENSHEKLFC